MHIAHKIQRGQLVEPHTCLEHVHIRKEKKRKEKSQSHCTQHLKRAAGGASCIVHGNELQFANPAAVLWSCNSSLTI